MEGAEESGIRNMSRAFMMVHCPPCPVSLFSFLIPDPELVRPCHYHFDEEDRAGEVWALLHVPDDGRLHPLPTALDHQAR